MQPSASVRNTINATPTIAMQHAMHLRATAEEEAIDWRMLLAQCNLPLSLFDDAERHITLTDYVILKERLAALLYDETCHLSKRQLLPGSTNFALAQLPKRGNLETAVTQIANAYNLLHGGNYNRPTQSETYLSFEIDDRNFPYQGVPQDQIYFVMETTILFVLSLLRCVAPGIASSALRRVCLRRPGKSPVDYAALLGVEVVLDADVYSLDFDAEMAKRMVVLSPSINNDEISREVLALTSGQPEYAPIEVKVREQLSLGRMEQTDVCAALDISPATLRRRLSEAGTSFRSLREAVLNTQAIDLLASDLALTDISNMLGFSDVRSFNRAFKSWNGATPKVYRDAHFGANDSNPER